MSISNSDTVDILVETKGGEVLLVVSDHLEWSKENEHMALLQKKLNTYIHVLKSGRVFEGRDHLRGKKFIIQIDFKYAPSTGAVNYINRIRPTVQGYGFHDLRYNDCSKAR